jgi:hypothetical protein
MDDIVRPPKQSAKPKGMRGGHPKAAMHQVHLQPAARALDAPEPESEPAAPLPVFPVSPLETETLAKDQETALEPQHTKESAAKLLAPSEQATSEAFSEETTLGIPEGDAAVNQPEAGKVIQPASGSSEPTEAPLLASPVKTPRFNIKKFSWKVTFRHIHLSKKQWAVVIAIVLILLAGGVAGASTLYHHVRKPIPQAVQAKTVKKVAVVKKPTLEPSHLTGSLVSPADNLRPVTGMMIENSPDARPQSGLDQAGVVYEAIAEGGITRFLAVFQEARPGYIGPVRSVRPYYLDFLMPYDASIAHVGGAPQALSDIKTLGIKDLDQFYNGNSYTRITTRYAPHNVYTSFDMLDALNTSKSFTSSTFTGFVRKAEEPSKVPTAKTIDVAISGPEYDSHYEYDATANNYKRSEGGAPHTDQRSGHQLTPKVVVTLVMSRGIDSDGAHTDYTTSGSGAMFVFQDGTVTSGTWSKASRKDQFMFTNAQGTTLKLNPGQTWITLVDAATNVTYK